MNVEQKHFLRNRDKYDGFSLYFSQIFVFTRRLIFYLIQAIHTVSVFCVLLACSVKAHTHMALYINYYGTLLNYTLLCSILHDIYIAPLSVVAYEILRAHRNSFSW